MTPHDCPGLVADLVNRPVTVIAAGDLPSALAAKAAAATIPIVFETAADPVQAGLVAILTTAAGWTRRIPKSTLSHRIQRLETKLGVRLLNRTSRRFAMTDAGEEFYRHAVAAIHDAHEPCSRLAASTSGQRVCPALTAGRPQWEPVREGVSLRSSR
jgi:hypothetical protein